MKSQSKIENRKSKTALTNPAKGSGWEILDFRFVIFDLPTKTGEVPIRVKGPEFIGEKRAEAVGDGKDDDVPR